MSAIRIAHPQVSKRFVHHGLTLGCVLRLTALRAGKLVPVRMSGNSHQRRLVARQIRRALSEMTCAEWLIAVHKAHGNCM